MENTNLNFGKNFKAKVTIADLEKLGWFFEYEDTANALNISLLDAEKYVKDIYAVEITVNEDGQTFWRYVNIQKATNGYNEGSDKEATGDDEQTIIDLQELYGNGDLWDSENYID